MPNIAVTLSTTKGVSSILYGTDPHNYVDTSSTIPVFRAGLNGGTKNYQALTTVTVTTTTNTNDTLTIVDSGSAIAKVVMVVSAGADSMQWNCTLTNLSTTNTITEWDLKAWSHLFEGAPATDGVNAWGQSDHGYDINAGQIMGFMDTVQSTNPWQIWCSDDGGISAQPINFHFAARGSTHPALWDVYFDPDTSQPGVYDVAPLAPGASYTWVLKTFYYATQQDITTVNPASYSIQATRWPMQVNQTKFPTRKGFGLNFFCSDGSNYTSNPNGWNNDSTMALYNSDGTLQASTGSYTGLNALWSFISGRTLWCNHITRNAGGIGVIHWDFWWGGRYPQPGVDYIGDPTVSQSVVPEIWYSDANFSPNIVTRWVNSAMQYAYNGGNPPAYLGSSWMVGAALRGSLFHLGPPASQSTYPDLQTGINDLTAKINYLIASPYNHTVFYIDSFGPFNTPPSAYSVDLLRSLMTSFPNVLLIPEAYSRADVFSCSYPWRDLQPTRNTGSGSIFTPQAPLIWNSAACACRFEKKGSIDMTPGSDNYPNAIALAKQAYNVGGSTGDCVIANCYSGTPTEFEQIMALYAGIASGTLMATWNSNGSDVTNNSGYGSGGITTYTSGKFSVQYIHDHFAAAGDTIAVPSGSFTWSTGVSLTTAVSLVGAGTANTTITNPSGTTSDGTPTVLLTCPSTGNMKVNNIAFSGQDIIKVTSTDGYPAFWIDSCSFDNSTTQSVFMWLYISGAPGLISNCTFSAGSASEMIHHMGYGSTSTAGWTNDLTPAGSEMLFIEDCTFSKNILHDQYFWGTSAVQSYYGARTVVRHCTLNYCQIDQHGTAGNIGVRWWEVYDNNWVIPTYGAGGGNQSAYADFRAGSGVFWGNSLSGATNAVTGNVLFREEDTGSYPATYQVGRGWGSTGSSQNLSPAYYWANDSGLTFDPDGGLVQSGRDVYSSSTKPSTLKVWQKSTDTSTSTYSYTPYTYPHPLRSAPMPVITSVSPTTGTSAGGTSVTITGTGFYGGTGSSVVSDVLFGSTAATSFTVNSDTSITATAPAEAGGTTDVRVKIESVTSSSDNYGFLPAITSVSPTTGTSAGGTVVTVNGTGFTGATSVAFGSTNGTSLGSITDTSLQITSPAEAGATVDITVTTPVGTSSAVSADHFGFLPAVTSISPTAGPIAGGTVVTVSGTGFTGATSVAFGGTNGTSLGSITDTSLSITSPAGSVGAADVKVTTPVGTSAAVSADHFNYKQASFVQGATVTGSNSTTTTTTLGSNTAAGNTILVTISWAATTGSVSSVTDTASNTYTKILNKSDTAHSSEIWYATNVAATNSVTVTTSTSIVHRMCVAEYTGAVTIASSASSTGTGTSPSSGNASTTNTYDTLIGYLKTDQALTTEGSGYTTRVSSSGLCVIADDYLSASGSFSYSATIGASSAWTACVVILHPS